ncbi:MAG: VWA domain-containing protein [Rhodanobacteraceae bacterium]|nr:VWA domain-containing protein [Rhodanobacteraceae bacterium]
MNDAVHAQRTAPRAIVRAPSPLSATAFRVDIDGLLATLTLTQDYANREDCAIEVSYTLALPQGACLLDVEVAIGDRRLRGRVEPKQQAEMRYEQALAEGHSAFSIRMVDDGLINIALGNLLPGETLTLTIRMAQWLHWNGNRVRLTVPTTLAPRYGQSRLQPADQPVVDLLAEHGFSLRGSVRGLLAQAELASASHRLAVRAVAGGIDFAIERGHLDRDIVIDLRDAGSGARIAGSVDTDLGGLYAAMVSFCASADAGVARPLVAEIVVDCSGSMGGVSIEQTRSAVRAILARLDGRDRVNILRFGSSHQRLLRRPQPVTPAVQRTLLDGADELQADLGGTELLAALNAGLEDLARLPADTLGERVLFVISDGEVWNLDTRAFLERCARDGVRVYAVAVGTAAVEATFAPLTRATGGALERVLPGDAMAERIERHFARMRTGALREIRVAWPGTPAWTLGPAEVHPGDGVILAAALDNIPEAVEVSWQAPDGERRSAQVALHAAAGGEAAVPSAQARMLARERLATLGDAAAATALAVDYQLVTPDTAITLVLQRAEAERQQQLPELRQVEQMLAAGWGGTAVHEAGAEPHFAPPMVASAAADTTYDCDLPVFLLRQGDAAPSPRPAAPAPAAKGMLHRAAAKIRQAVLGEAPDTAGAVRSPDAAMRSRLCALLLARLKSDPALLAALAEGRWNLETLALDLDTATFNWLDERAERFGSDLQSGGFWQRLVDELCASPEGAELRRILGR